MSTLQKVKPGDPLVIPAGTFNTFIDAARDYLDRRHRTAVPMQPAARPNGIVLVKNTSGAAVDRFGVLGLDVPIFTPTDSLASFLDRPAFRGVAPTAADHAGRFAVVLEPLADGAIGQACCLGVCPVKVDIAAETQTHADVADGLTTHLAGATSCPARILWKEDGTGVKWALVQLGPPPAGSLAWGQAVMNWARNAGDPYALCNPCDDRLGANPDTAATVRVYLPASPGRDPNVVAGQVIGYVPGPTVLIGATPTPTATAVAGYLDDAIGTVKMWTSTLAVPAGWEEYAGMQGRFPVGYKSGDASFGTLESTGGSAEHCHAIQRNPASTPCGSTFIDEGTWNTMMIGIANRTAYPPFRVVKFIRRMDNSV